MDCFVAKNVNAPRNDGFTLAEILITLVIIGVIAAITVPSLINKTNNQEYVSKLKKTYSTLSQATNSIIAENGTPKASVGGWATDVDSIYKLYKPHLHIEKDCGSGTGCFRQLKEAYKTLNGVGGGGNYEPEDDNFRKLVLTDGTQIVFDGKTLSNDCSNSGAGSNNFCIVIKVDINGEKKPNIMGKDFLQFVLKNNGLYPRGCDGEECIGTQGGGCTCKIIREDAMNY